MPSGFDQILLDKVFKAIDNRLGFILIEVTHYHKVGYLIKMICSQLLAKYTITEVRQFELSIDLTRIYFCVYHDKRRKAGLRPDLILHY